MSRFLFTVIPSQMYSTKTLDVLLQAMVTDLEDIHRHGVEVPRFELQATGHTGLECGI